MDNKFLNKVSSLLFYFSILLFIIAFNFADNPASGWYQQFLPNLNNRPLADITFTDSLTGYAIVSVNNAVDTSFIIKTTNGGVNWNVIMSEYEKIYRRIVFLNNNTGYVGGGRIDIGSSYLIKTINGGLNWVLLNSPFILGLDDMYILNEDTIWIVSSNGFDGGIYRTTNGGINWTFQFQNNNILKKIYMYNARIGFASTDNLLFKTTNSGVNWNQVPGQNGFINIYLVDSLTGWKTQDSTRKTTDGGITWNRQYIPKGGNISNSFSTFLYFSNINKDTIWGSGGVLEFPGFRYRAFLYHTTNGGDNWLYQVPDTSFGIPGLVYINFIDKNTGWSYFYNGIHTTVGGDTTFFTKINSNVLNEPMNYVLVQNYPNPFNPSTIIKYEIRKSGNKTNSSYILIRVYDALGKEIRTLVNQKKDIGTYKVEFNGTSLPSGIYFYALFADGQRVDTKKMMLLK